MPISVRVFRLPKAGNRDDEYEDACWPARSLSTDRATVRCAIADGATESAFAGLWARQLVSSYGAGRLDGAKPTAALLEEQRRWQAEVASRPLPWYAEEKARSGAFAALLGLTVERDAGRGVRAWHAMAVGDCALFHVRGGVLLRSFPAETTSFFTNRPHLLSSIAARNGELSANTQRVTGELHTGDALYLATDALSQWLLSAIERGESPWRQVETVVAPRRRDFAAWIDACRRSRGMRNDDVTLMRITWSD